MLALDALDERERQQPSRPGSRRTINAAKPSDCDDGEALGGQHERHQRAEAVVAEASAAAGTPPSSPCACRNGGPRSSRQRPAVARRRGRARASGSGRLRRRRLSKPAHHQRPASSAPAAREPARRLRQRRGAATADDDGAERADHEHPAPALDPEQRVCGHQPGPEQRGDRHPDKAEGVRIGDIAAPYGPGQELREIGVHQARVPRRSPRPERKRSTKQPGQVRGGRGTQQREEGVAPPRLTRNIPAPPRNGRRVPT